MSRSKCLLGLLSLLFSASGAFADPVRLFSCLLDAKGKEATAQCLRNHSNSGDVTELFARGLKVPLEDLDDAALTTIAPLLTQPTKSQDTQLQTSFKSLDWKLRNRWLRMLTHQTSIDLTPYFRQTQPKDVFEMDNEDLAQVLAAVNWSQLSEFDFSLWDFFSSSLPRVSQVNFQWTIAAADLIRAKHLFNTATGDRVENSGCLAGIAGGGITCGIGAAVLYATMNPWALLGTVFGTWGTFAASSAKGKYWAAATAGKLASGLLHESARIASRIPEPVDPAFTKAYVELAKFILTFIKQNGADQFASFGLSAAIDELLSLKGRLALSDDDAKTISKLETLRSAMKATPISPPKKLTICQTLVVRGALGTDTKPEGIPEL